MKIRIDYYTGTGGSELIAKQKCDMCLGCIYNCPQKALIATYGGFQVDKKGHSLKAMQNKMKLR